MGLRLSTAAQQDAAQQFLREQFKGPQEPAAGENFAAVQNLETVSRLQYRGRMYLVPPIGYKDGITLQRLYFKLQRMGILDEQFEARAESEHTERLLELEQLLNEMAEAFKAVCYPQSWLLRTFWRWMKNPFLDATQQEVGEILGFFSVCRMKSTVAFADKHPAEQPKGLTQSMS